MSATITPEIREAIRTARAVHFRLEDEYHPFGWEERLETAAMVREIATDTEGRARQLAEAVEFRLESEAFDFTDWQDRCETINLTRSMIAELTRQEGGAR
jgi:hypothetical protein